MSMCEVQLEHVMVETLTEMIALDLVNAKIRILGAECLENECHLTLCEMRIVRIRVVATYPRAQQTYDYLLYPVMGMRLEGPEHVDSIQLSPLPGEVLPVIRA